MNVPRKMDLRYLSLSAVCFVWTAVYPTHVEAMCKPGAVLKPGDQVVNLEFEGNSRSYTIHIPPKYDGRTPMAVVFDLHGSSGTSSGQLTASGFRQVADKYNFIVVAPQGYMNFWNGDIA